MPRFIQRNYSAALGGGVCRTSTVGLDVNTSGASAAFWYYPLAADGNVMVSFENGANSATFRLNIENNTGKLFTWTVTSSVGRAHKPSYVISLNTWHYIVVTYANIGGTSRRSTIYVDGVSIGTETSAGLADTSSRFSCSTGATSRLESDIRVFNSELSASDVSNLYYNNLNPSTPTINWRLDEGEGSSATDFSGNGWTGTITSAIWTSNTPMKARFLQRNANAAISLDGSTSFLAKASPTGINNGTNGSISFSGWMYLTSNVLGTVVELHVNNGTSPSFGMGQQGGVYYLFSDRVNALNNKTITTAAFSQYIGLGRWVRMTYVLTSTAISVYAGKIALLSASALGTAINAGTISSLFLGKGQTVGQVDIQPLGAYLKDWRAFNGALTQTEVNGLVDYNIIPSSVVSGWGMDEGAGSTVTDAIGTNNLTGTALTWTSDRPFAAKKASVNANMVKNGDFEYAPPFTAATTAAARFIDGTSGGSTTNDLFSWATVSGAVTASAAASFDTTVSFSGSNSIKLSTLNTSGAIVVANTTATGAPTTTVGLYRLSPNTSYTLTAKCKTSNVASNGAFVFIREYTSALAIVATNNTAKLSGTNDWTTLSVTITTGATTQYAAVALCNNVAGNVSDAWFDDISLTPVYPEGRVPANGNLVKNFDFEVAPTFVAATTTASRFIDGTSGGSTTNSTYKWAVENNGSAGSFSARFDTTSPLVGTYSMKLSTTATASAISVRSIRNSSTTADILRNAIPVAPSTSYTVSFRMKTNLVSGSATSGAFLRINQYNGLGAAVVNSDSTKVQTTTDDTLYSFQFTTSATTMLVIPNMQVIGNDGAATLVMDAWFDDIYLAKTTNPGRVLIT